MTRMAARLARRWDRGTTPRLIALVVAIGLLTPTPLRVLGPDGAAWLPDHGHIFLTSEAAARPHSHPWDHDGVRAPAATTPAGTTHGVLFTPGDFDAASSFAALALPVFALACAVAWASDRVEAPRLVLLGRRFAPLAPPPQR